MTTTLLVHGEETAVRTVPTRRTDHTVRTVDSPVGPLMLTATDAGLAALAFGWHDGDPVTDGLQARFGRGLARSRRLDEVARQLDEYFAGRRRRFEVPVDLEDVHGFRRRTLDAIATIPYGSTATYAAVAVSLGRPGAVRAVGSACASNPVPIVVPCHRVVRSDGTVGEFLGGGEVKQALLALEAVPTRAA